MWSLYSWETAQEIYSLSASLKNTFFCHTCSLTRKCLKVNYSNLAVDDVMHACFACSLPTLFSWHLHRLQPRQTRVVYKKFLEGVQKRYMISAGIRSLFGTATSSADVLLAHKAITSRRCFLVPWSAPITNSASATTVVIRE